MAQTLSARNSAATVSLNSINPIRTGERVRLWAAGATATGDTLTMKCGMAEIFSGNINVEASADVVDTDRDLCAVWTNQGGDGDLSMVFGAATSGFVLMIEGPNRGG